MTPTISTGRPSTATRRPTTPRSAPNRRSHAGCVRIATASLPGIPSPAVNARPSAGSISSVGSSEGVTRTTSTRSLPGPRPSRARAESYIPIDSIDRARSRTSR